MKSFMRNHKEKGYPDSHHVPDVNSSSSSAMSMGGSSTLPKPAGFRSTIDQGTQNSSLIQPPIAYPYAAHQAYLTMAEDGKKFVIENQSPYFLHPLESPGALITAVIFDGKNFDLWQKAVQTSLKSKNKLGFIDGTLKRPEASQGGAELQAWEMVNSMVRSWILNVIDPRLQTSVAFLDTAQAVWNNLCKRYSVANALKIHQLKASIAGCKQGGADVVEFYSRLIGLWSELENYQKIPVCTCSGCKCEAASKFVKMIEEEKTHQFLMGLDDDSFGRKRSQILALEPLPSLDKIFKLIQQEENHKNLMVNRDDKGDSVAAFAMSHGAKVQTTVVEKPTYKHYGQLGHEESQCSEIIGYPPGWGSRGRGRGRGRKTRGGRASSERGRGASNESAYAVTTRAVANLSTNVESGSSSLTGFTPEQVQRLLSLIETSKPEYEKLSGLHIEELDWSG